MDENKQKKFNTSTLICIFIIFILILVILGMWYYYSVIKVNSTNENINTNNMANIETNVDKDENSTNTSSIDNSNTNIPELTLSDAKKLIEKNLEIRGSYIGSPLELSLFDSELNADIEYSIPTSDNYVNTNVEYNVFKSTMLKYMTEELFQDYNYYKSIDGVLYAFSGGASGISYSDVELTLISDSDNIYKYSVNCLAYPPENGELEQYYFTIEYVNNNYVVSDIQYIN